MSDRRRRPSGDTLLGIDIGGTGIKGAPVDTTTGELAGERLRIATPKPATPAAVAEVVAEIAAANTCRGPIGVTFPAVVRDGVVASAANVDKRWIGTDAVALLEARLGRPVVVLNDADAAGIAEMTYGAGRDRGGVVVMVTFGTGIGSALFLDGRLVPNTELGHIIVAGKDGERLAAASVKARKMLTWKAWSKRVNAYLERLDQLVSPDLIIIGGGVSKDHARFLPRLKARAEVVPAQLFNEAGIVGAPAPSGQGLGATGLGGLTMPEVGFTNLFLILVVALAIPLILGMAPRLRIPAAVFEIVAGMVVGPAGLGLVERDEVVRVMAVLGLAFLLFLGGTEIELDRLRGMLLRRSLAAFAASVVLGLLVGGTLAATGIVGDPLLVAVILLATSLGVVVPVLRDARDWGSVTGQTIIAGASVADFGAVVLLSVFFGGEVPVSAASSSWSGSPSPRLPSPSPSSGRSTSGACRPC